jgi:hypothetical protein
MQTPSGRGSRHYIGVSGQRHAPTALYPRRKDHRYPLNRRFPLPGIELRSCSPQSDTILTELSRLVDARKFCTERFGCFLPSALWADPSAVVHTVTDNSNPPRPLPVFDPITIPASGFVSGFFDCRRICNLAASAVSVL